MHHCSTYFIKNKGVFAPPMLSDSDFKLCYTIPYTLIINISRGQVPMIYTKVTIFFFKSKRVWLPKMAFKSCPVDRHHDHMHSRYFILKNHGARKWAALFEGQALNRGTVDTVCSVYLKDMIGSFSKLRGGSNNPDSWFHNLLHNLPGLTSWTRSMAIENIP